jgi:hypothetical protein
MFFRSSALTITKGGVLRPPASLPLADCFPDRPSSSKLGALWFTAHQPQRDNIASFTLVISTREPIRRILNMIPIRKS